MPALNLHLEASTLASSLSKTLNRTVCNGVQLNAVIRNPIKGAKGGMNIGYQISPKDQDLQTGIPLTISAKKAKFYLGFFMHLEADETAEYMMVKDSMALLTLDADLSQELLHYDYQRDKEVGYPEAHLQICASSEHWDVVSGYLGDRPLSKLHLPVGPVGGRRFRPSLEDVLELLIVERFVEPRDGWQEALDETRRPFQELQLRAAVRRNQELAADALKKLGWKIEPPSGS